MRRTTRKKNRPKHRIITLTILGICALIVGLYVLATSPIRSARTQAVQLAEKYANLKTEDKFYYYNRDKTYYTVAGTNKKNQKIYAVIAQNGKKINIYQKSEGISEAKAKTLTKNSSKVKKITHVALGMYKNKPVWEVSYTNEYGNLCYDLLNFKDGKVIKTIQNI